MRGGQQAQRHSGSAPIAFRPGVSSTTSPRFKSRMRVVDQRMAPGRDLDPTVCAGRRVVVVTIVVPEAERTGTLALDPLGPRDFLQRLGKLVDVAEVEREAPPCARLLLQVTERYTFETRLDRQQ